MRKPERDEGLASIAWRWRSDQQGGGIAGLGLPGLLPVEERPRERLRCRACHQLVTDNHEAVTVAGAHRHQCENPDRVRYRIALYRSAPGVVEVGQPIARFSWFKGFAWRLALCSHCGSHLGWAFQAAGETRFYGLIVDRLAQEPG